MVVWCDPDDETVIYWTHKGLKCKPEDVHKADLDALILAYEAMQNGQATEVIRCKDCIHSGQCTKEIVMKMRVGSYLYCPMGNEGFCSHGERREDE